MNKKAILLMLLTAAFSSSINANSDSLKQEAKKKSPYRGTKTRHTDILHTRLDVQFDWEKSQMTGKAAITAKPYFKSSSTLTLDARGMDVSTVEVYDLGAVTSQKPGMPPANPEIPASRKLASSYKYENDSLKINLGKEFKADEKYLVKINYMAKPNTLKKGGSDAISDDKGLYFINPKGTEKNKMPQIWTQGETQASSAWFPTIDSPNEKMTNEIYMTVDNKYTTLSNGVLADSKKNTDGTRTDHWKMDLPHSPYLVMMGVGEFKKVTDVPWNGKEVSYYVEKEYEPYAKDIFGNTREMIEFFSKVLGTPYPWQKYAQIVVRDYVSGAMENTSATLHGDFMVYQTKREMIDGRKGEDVISHELFHQWFGDLVTAESWSNLPLNESFATYGEYLWDEYKYGRDAADAHSYSSRQGYFNEAKQKQVDLIRYEYVNREDMFDAFSYNKGGQVLHMLRKYVGDPAFFASLKLYLERNRFKSAEIHDLRLAFEETTGEDLNWFFNQWFLSKGHPDLEVTKAYDPSTQTLKLTVTQKQNLNEFPLYTMPLEVDIYTGDKKERHRISIDQPTQTFAFKCAQPDLVNFDAERQLLAYRTYTKTTAELMFQYHHAPLYNDRLESLSNLKTKLDEPGVLALMMEAAEKDPWYELQEAAMYFMKAAAPAHETELRPLLVKLATSDKKSNVRSAAIDNLSQLYKGNDLEELYVKALNEQSYAVCSSALGAIAVSNPSLALQKCAQFENEKNMLMYSAISGIYAKHGTDANNAYFVKSADYFSAFSLVTYVKQYSKFLERCDDPRTFESAAGIFAELIKTGNDYVKDYTRKAYQDNILGTLKTRAETLKTKGQDVAALENMHHKLDERLKSI